MGTDVIDLAQPGANMFGIVPCPVCKGKYRSPYAHETGTRIECDDCGFMEMAGEPQGEGEE